jgi:hypothetical protein
VVSWLLVLGAAAGLAAYVCGVLSASHGRFWVNPRGAETEEFDWPNAMLAATAAGTVLLGAFTAALAYTTSGDVSATWRLAQLTAEDQAAREQSIILIDSVGIGGRPVVGEIGDDGERFCVYQFDVWAQIRNIGSGPAVKVELRVRYVGSDPEMKAAGEDHVVFPVVTAQADEARGHSLRFERRDRGGGWSPENVRDGHFRAEVTFLDRRLRPAGPAIDLSQRPL